LEWVPISSGLKPSLLKPVASTADLESQSKPAAVNRTCWLVLGSIKLSTVVLKVEPGNLSNRRTVHAVAFTRHMQYLMFAPLLSYHHGCLFFKNEK
jgi:hypothetical protein